MFHFAVSVAIAKVIIGIQAKFAILEDYAAFEFAVPVFILAIKSTQLP